MSLIISSLPQVIEQSLFLFVPGRKAQTFPEPRIPPSPLRRSKGGNVVQRVSGTQIFTRSSSQLTYLRGGEITPTPPKTTTEKKCPMYVKHYVKGGIGGEGGEIIFTLYPDGIIMIAACSPSSSDVISFFPGPPTQPVVLNY